jgi:FkbM family methyltransferase
MITSRCGVGILPDGDRDLGNLLRSVNTAQATGLGDFTEIVCLPVLSGPAPEALRAAAEAALTHGCDWLLAVSAAETLVPDTFVKIAPALRLHDAIWGAAGLSTPAPIAPDDPRRSLSAEPEKPAVTFASLSAKPERITRLAAQDLPGFFHAALAWWIGPSHFVRPQLALDALHQPVTAAWYADYMLSLWRDARVYKTAQALTSFEGALPPVSQADRARLIETLEGEPAFMDVHHAAHTLRLPYTGVNPVIEREQMRGQFFEPDELRYLAGRLPRGLKIVDAGANTGNHTVFFAAVMEAERVLPIEPHPRAAAAVQASVSANRLGNVDLSCLGVALGASAGRLRPVLSAGGGLGATRYVPDPDGPITVAQLDELAPGPVDFVKIDVEGMEMDVLASASALIARHRPALYIEILDANVRPFMAWVDAHGYRVEKLFPDKTHCNYFVVPD